MPVSFKQLDNALKKMGGKLEKYDIDPIVSENEIEIKLKEGVEISRAEFDEIVPIAGLLNFKDHHAFLYIDEPYQTLEELQEIPCEKGPRFHIVKECKTLQRMHERAKSYRYVLIQNTNGEFPCYPWDREKRQVNKEIKYPAKLLACYNCMTELNYKGFNNKTNLEQRRDIRSLDFYSFLKHYEPFFIDSKYYRQNKMEQNGNYSIDHASIRDRLLRQTDYTCQGSELKTGKCDVQLKDHPEWLHMHHINGRSGDNRLENLKILCISCHQRQPLHEKMTVPARARMEIARRRKIVNQN